MRVELVGCKHEGEHNSEKEGGEGWGTGRGQGSRTLRGRDPEGDKQGLGEPVREEEKQH